MSLEQTEKGRSARSYLREQICARIAKDNVTPDQLAERLGLLPVGAEVLLARDEWSLDTALRIAEAVGLEVKLEIVGG
jgi:hypothetical protein